MLVDGKPDVALRRDDGYLWVVLPEGVHRVRVEGLLADVGEWEWTFQLKPHRVTIEAPGWTFSGVRPDGVPEQQVFFARKQKSTAGEASYDRQDFQTVAAIDRNLELGLVWQVRSRVTRLSPAGKAIALRIPLLSGENVLSSNTVVKEGFIEVRLGANDSEFAWESELPVVDRIKLATNVDDSWVERWHLVASPVWNLAISGLAPTFEPGNPELVPVWHPWPGEGVELAVSRPEAVAGATVTVLGGTHEIALGKRQRVSKLDLSLRCSLGEDFLVELPADADVTSLSHNGETIPVRKDGTKLVVPLRPGEQSISVGWKINAPLGFRATAEEVRLPVQSANINTVDQRPGEPLDSLGGRAPARPGRAVLEHSGLCAACRVGARPHFSLAASFLRMDASRDRFDAGPITCCFGRDRLALLPGLARTRLVPPSSPMGLQFAADLSDRSNGGCSRHLCGGCCARTPWQPGDVHRGQRLQPHLAPLVSGHGPTSFCPVRAASRSPSGGIDFSCLRGRCGLPRR